MDLIITELKNRGVKEKLIATADSLKGFTESIESIFPEYEDQQSIIHQIRNILKHTASKNQKNFMTDLQPFYKAPMEEAGLLALDRLEEKFGKKYPYPINSCPKDSFGVEIIGTT
ncbi:MAG: transposase [Bacteroidetes bacterium]|nr:transposase [Bacteroidota bacterium]MBU1116547.1 transposase [Bacteroidota bacterium]MBU1797563.1 transposase [Bacteroidota bacterium]